MDPVSRRNKPARYGSQTYMIVTFYACIFVMDLFILELELTSVRN